MWEGWDLDGSRGRVTLREIPWRQSCHEGFEFKDLPMDIKGTAGRCLFFEIVQKEKTHD
jgi:hypothetical protein